MTTAVVPEREYGVSKCFGCQHCLLCGTSCVYDMCSCEIDQKPTTKQRKKGKKKAAQKRSFSLPSALPAESKSYVTSPVQLEFLKACNGKFGYAILFDRDFEFYFCSTCNSRFEKTKKTVSLAENSVSSSLQESPTPFESQSSFDGSASQNSASHSSPLLSAHSSFMSADEPLGSSPLHLQLVVKKGDGNNLPVKWVKVSTEDFFSFESEIEDHVRNLSMSEGHKEISYRLSYKPSNSRVLAASLMDEDDFKIFVEECKKLINNQKNMMVFATFKSTETEKKKASKKRMREVLDFVT